jgi:hypothetical protein
MRRILCTQRLAAAAAVWLFSAVPHNATASDPAGPAPRAGVHEHVPPGHIRQAYPIGDLLGQRSGGAPVLMQLLTATVAPQSWKEAGGRGEVRYESERQQLVVVQTPERQGEVTDLLDALRRLMRQKAPERMPVGPKEPDGRNEPA